MDWIMLGFLGGLGFILSKVAFAILILGGLVLLAFVTVLVQRVITFVKRWV